MNQLRKTVGLLLLSICSISLHAQNQGADAFDFWVGNWNLTWQGQGGKTEKGKNVISKTLDGKVIQENFEALEGAQKGYKGMSISVYNPGAQTWHQTWMDNQGGNINFTRQCEEGKKMFTTGPRDRNGQKVISRMVFYDIKEDSFTWDWESSTDDGATWKLNWRINYTRAKSGS